MLPASDLVEDATGRGSRCAAWLNALGHAAVELTIERSLTGSSPRLRMRRGSNRPRPEPLFFPPPLSFFTVTTPCVPLHPPRTLRAPRGIAVLRHFFGEIWFQKHVMNASAQTDFLRRDFTTDERRETHGFRVMDLAEMLFNLQDVRGFDACIQQMRTGQIEATYAELEIAKSLCAHQVKFTIVVPSGRRGADYDLEIIYPDGMTVCADTKCKVETTESSTESIQNSLGQARKQLPPDRPGAVFVKVPQLWIDEATFRDSIIGEAEAFLRGTGRIVSVKFYVSTLVFQQNMAAHLMRYREISNPFNRFDANRDWDLFSDHDVPAGWNGMPSNWLRLMYFPDGPDEF